MLFDESHMFFGTSFLAQTQRDPNILKNQKLSIASLSRRTKFG